MTGLVASFHSILYAYGRQIYSLARAGYFPEWLSGTHGGRQTPHRALIAGSVLGFAAAVAIRLSGPSGSVGATLLNMAVFGAVLAYVMQMAAFILLRRNAPGLLRPYVSPLGMPGAVVAALLATVTLAALFLNPDYRIGVLGAAVWFVVRTSLFRPTCKEAADPLTGGEIRHLYGGQTRKVGGLAVSYSALALGTRYHFEDLRTLLAKASPSRSGDELAGIAAGSATERAAAQMALADVPLREFLREPLIPYEDDEVTRLIFDTHDEQAFAPVSHLTVGDFSNWLLSPDADADGAHRALTGNYPRDGRGRFKADANSGPHRRGFAHPGGHAIPNYGRIAGPPFYAPAAQSSNR